MFITLILFFVGFYILIKGANILVEGASSLARKFKISEMVVGLLIVGIGTSIPEFAITVLANLVGESDVGLATVIGSNTFNIFFILGLSAFLFPLKFRTGWVHNDLAWNVFSVLAVVMFALWYPFQNGETVFRIGRLEGLIMFSLFVVWVYYTMTNSKEAGKEQEPLRVLTLPLSWVMILGGMIGVVLGGKWVVDGAVEIARGLTLSETLVGLTIVSVGTSLPELAVSIAAARKKLTGIAVGNIIGSNIFDFLMILGVSAMIKPILFPQKLFVDVAVTLLSSLLLLLFMFTGKRYSMGRLEGVIFIIFYILYLFFLMGRG